MQELRRLLRKQDPRRAGEDGEKLADKWLRRHGWTYQPVDQGIASLAPELREYGGKRPDFVALDKSSRDLLLLDAKYHSTDDGRVFRLSDPELDQYRRLKAFAEDFHGDGAVWVLFMLFPKEYDGQKLVWVDLEEFDSAPIFEGWAQPARELTLLHREGLWFDN